MDGNEVSGRDGANSRTHRRKPKAKLKLKPQAYAVIAILVLVLLIAFISILSAGGKEESSREEKTSEVSLAELSRLRINELGSVMVLEYHAIGEEGRWSRTPENFRNDLETLYAEGYRCIRLKDFATNNIKTELGFTPVVLTFDDSTESQFRYIERDGELIIDPDSAMGIMEQFKAEHPDFNMTATFYVLPSLFGQEEYMEKKLNFLVDNGYCIGNHTVNHEGLGNISAEKGVQEIVGNIEMVQKYLPGYEQKSIALPLGSEPEDQSILVSGSLGNTSYNFVASLLVGSNPSPSPNDAGFDAMRMPRVQVLAQSLDQSNLGSEAWLQFYRENPERRYRSDGNPDTVTIPAHALPRIHEEAIEGKELIVY